MKFAVACFVASQSQSDFGVARHFVTQIEPMTFSPSVGEAFRFDLLPAIQLSQRLANSARKTALHPIITDDPVTF